MRAVLLLLVAACAARPAPIPTKPTSTTVAALGETLTLESKVLGERRVINVYVPPGYAKSTDRYPVLYMPDGGMAEDFPHVVGAVDVSVKNGIIRPMIVVGIENTVRRRDLPGVTAIPEEQKAAPQAGGSDRFREMLRTELKPMIAARYRVTEESAIIGESLAGLFVIETFLVEPALFDSYVAVDPSVWWNEMQLVRDGRTRLAWWNAGPKQLYIATADDPRTHEGVAILTTALGIYAPQGVTWHHQPMPDEEHHTIYPFAALRGLRRLFAVP